MLAFVNQNKRSYNIFMEFRVSPDPYQKLSLLDNATQFEPAGSDPMLEKELPGSRRPKPLPCVSNVTTPTGPKPVLKAMMTTACEKNCNYCPFRAGRSQTTRVTFTPDEMAKTYDTIQRAGIVDGMFLSSGIIKGGVTTQDKIIDTGEILRKRYGYRGYIHLKIMPGAEYDQIRRAMQIADRVSVNQEGATRQRLEALAPKTDYWNELCTRLQWTAQPSQHQGTQVTAHYPGQGQGQRHFIGRAPQRRVGEPTVADQRHSPQLLPATTDLRTPRPRPERQQPNEPGRRVQRLFGRETLHDGLAQRVRHNDTFIVAAVEQRRHTQLDHDRIGVGLG